MTPGLAIIAAAIFIFGVMLPASLMLAREAKNSIYGAGAARRYLAELVKRAKREPWEFEKDGVSAPPWVVFPNIGSQNTEEWMSDMVESVASIAPDDVEITGYGTSIRMTPKRPAQ